VLCVWFFHAPLEHHADPGVTPLHTTAPWYFLWLQGLLKLGDKVLFGVIFPGILLTMFAAWPYLDTTPSRRYAHRKFALSLSMGFLTFMLVLTYMGTPKYGVASSGDVEVAQGLAPVEGVGDLRAVPFDQLALGSYCTDNLDRAHQLTMAQTNDQLASDPLPDTKSAPITCQAVPAGTELYKTMQHYQELMKLYSPSLVNGIGVLTISANQTVKDTTSDLKRIDIKLLWNLAQTSNGGASTVMDSNGAPKLQTTTTKVTQTNADGTPKMDASNLAIQTDVTQPIVQASGKYIFVSRASDYQPGGE